MRTELSLGGLSILAGVILIILKFFGVTWLSSWSYLTLSILIIMPIVILVLGTLLVLAYVGIVALAVMFSVTMDKTRGKEK